MRATCAATWPWRSTCTPDVVGGIKRAIARTTSCSTTDLIENSDLRRGRFTLRSFAAANPFLHSFKIQIDNRRQVQGHDLRDAEPANNCEAKSTARRGAGAPAERDRQRSHQR